MITSVSASLAAYRVASRLFPAGFRMYRKLQPGPWFNSVSTLEYDRLYKAEVLALLDPAKVIADLEAIARGKIPVLCCYERAGSGLWCHRALAAQWLSDALGIKVPESATRFCRKTITR